MSDKPPEIRRSAKIMRNAAYHARTRASQLRQLPTIDDVVGSILDLLDDLDLDGSTWGLFGSDNGRFWGEHRLRGKVYAYEESVRVPFRMMLPSRKPIMLHALAANIDVAPTIADLAGDGSAHSFDGRSLLPLIADSGHPWRKNVLIEHFGGSRVRFDSLRTERWTYVVWRASGRRELYDRQRDPYQLKNVASKRPRVVRRLHRRVAVLAAS